MSHFGAYLKDLFHSWWAGVGALSVIGFFVPALNDYWPFIMTVAVLAFIGTGFAVDRRRVESHAAQVERIQGEHSRLEAGMCPESCRKASWRKAPADWLTTLPRYAA